MHDFLPTYGPFMPFMFGIILPLFFIVMAWSTAIKGYALWVAAHAEQKWWFIALLVVNTAGLLELIYLIWFSPAGSNKLHANKNPNTPTSQA